MAGLVHAQFSGGEADGFSSQGSGITSPNDQLLYCGGGNADGNHVSGTGWQVINDQDGYSSGGPSDGAASFSTGLASLNDQENYCFGGISDGVSSTSIFEYINETEFYCRGGDYDGNSAALANGYMFSLQFCLGGNGDGWIGMSSGMSNLNPQAFYCTAGEGDGHGAFLYSGSLISNFLYCLGGNGDGDHAFSSGLLNLGYGIWTGLISSTWSVDENWKHNAVPTINTSVLIPAGAANYPVMDMSFSVNSPTGTYQCKRLDIMAGGHLHSSSFITINGIVNISGILSFQQVTYNYLGIDPAGELNVKAGGVVNLGP